MHPGAEPRARPLALGLALVALVTLGVLSVASRAGDLGSIDRDLTADWLSARLLTSGRAYDPLVDLARHDLGVTEPVGIIEHRGNPHPPVAILVTVPVSRLSLRGAQGVWLLLSSMLVVASVAWILRATGIPRMVALALGIASLAFPVVQKDLSFGQSNAVLLILIVATWAALKAGRDGRAGLALGAAIALKAFPALLVLPLIAQRRVRAATVAIGSAAAATAAGLAVVGPHAAREWITHAQPVNFRVWRSAPTNVSLPGIPFRWLLQTPWRPRSPDVPILAFALAGALVVVCAAVAWRSPARRSGDRFLAALPLMLLASPLAWDHYAVAVLPLAGVLLVREIRSRAFSPLVMLGSALVIVGGPPGLPLRADRISDITQLFGYGLGTYGLVMLVLADLTPARGSRDGSRAATARPAS